MASHAAANLRKRSEVLIATPGARTLLEAQTPIPLNGSDWNEEMFLAQKARRAIEVVFPQGVDFGTGVGPF